jgi:hypothetical protein
LSPCVSLARSQALGRIVTSPNVRAQFAHNRGEYENRVQSILFARLDDEDIDVREHFFVAVSVTRTLLHFDLMLWQPVVSSAFVFHPV